MQFAVHAGCSCDHAQCGPASNAEGGLRYACALQTSVERSLAVTGATYHKLLAHYGAASIGRRKEGEREKGISKGCNRVEEGARRTRGRSYVRQHTPIVRICIFAMHLALRWNP